MNYSKRATQKMKEQHNVTLAVQIPGLPPIFTKVYETVPNGIYDDNIDGLTTELFTRNGYAVTVTDNEVLFERI